MPSQSLIESTKIPPSTKRSAGAALSEQKWQSLLGLVINGEKVAEACKSLSIGRGQLETAIRASKERAAGWEEAKRLAIRRQWDIETVEEILMKVAMNEKGGFLKRVIEDMGLDSGSFYKLLLKDPEIRSMYDEAREIQAEIQADEMREIAEDGRNDSYVDDKGRVRVDHDVLGRSKLRIDTLKWTMSKLHFKRFGDKIQQDQNINMVVDHAERLEKARKRAETMRDG